MSPDSHVTSIPTTLAPRRMQSLVVVAVACLVVLSVTFFIYNRVPFSLAVLAVPAGVIVVTSPRWSLYQFIFSCYLLLMLVESIPLFLIDLSAMVVIGAAVLDLLLSDTLPRRVPSIGYWYGAFVLALTVTGFLGYEPGLAVRPIARVVFLAATFLGVYRLSRHLDLSILLRGYFWLGVIHSILALIPFIASGGEVRSFGFALRILDELNMLALPIGIGYALWGDRHRLWYLVGSILVGGALIGTQSRAPIGFGGMAVLFVLAISWWQARKQIRRNEASNVRAMARRIRRRVWGLVALGCAAPLALIAAKPTLLLAVYERFDSLVTFEPNGTLLLRLQLWKRALTAFADHPIFGMGPGMFQHYGDIYATSHLNPWAFYISGLSAHNMTLHYMAETGIVGTSVLLGLFFTQFWMGRTVWLRCRERQQRPVAIAIYAIGVVLLVSTLVEGGWMFGGQVGFLAAFFLALISRAYTRSLDTVPRS